MNDTIGVAQKLSEAVKEIGVTLNLISEILSSTNLLALNASVADINTMGDAHNKQSDVIKNTVFINQDIAESIRNENEQFASINAMADSNANDIAEVAAQAGVINNMVDEMSKLLKQEN